MASPSETSVLIHSQDPTVRGVNRMYSDGVKIGRADECEVQVSAEMVSRIHGEVRFEGDHWLIEDRGSTNGIYHEGEAIKCLSIDEAVEVQLGTDGPRLRVEVVQDRAGASSSDGATRPESAPPTQQTGSKGVVTEDESKTELPSESASVTQYIQHYFESEDDAVGEETRMIREAYQKVQARQHRTYLGILAGVIVLCILLSGYALLQHVRSNQLREQAQQVWAGMKQQEVTISKLQRSVEASGNATLEKRLAALEEQWGRQQARYRGYVEELGLHRDLTQKEREIYRVARLFGESEFSVPAGFVRRVKQKIQSYWKGPARDGLVQSIRRAEKNGYTSFIVETMQDHDLPPEFFYLALQESRFNTGAVGPRTRWGIAKGMWQFIPKTARKYDLKLGPRVDQRVMDPQDERHDFKKSTRAAADYLKRIYSTRAQASGLLVVASYNWGEHRVVEKMKHLPGPQGIPEKALEGVPQTPESRNYWQFLTTYRDRMPAETKDYVLKIFSAAVIGQAPKLFGFAFENPLRDPLEAPSNPQAVSSSVDSMSDHSVSVPSTR